VAVGNDIEKKYKKGKEEEKEEEVRIKGWTILR